MNIQVRVMSAQAQSQLKAMEAEIAALQKQLAGGAAGAAAFSRALGPSGLAKWGNQLQWTGRQLQYNFTLPIALAAGAATKFALDNEAAFVRVQKVYGDAQHGAQFYAKELQSLQHVFEQLSDAFGVSMAKTTDIAAGWAAAGASGLALAKATKLTMETMILGELDADTATQSLIAIQAQYGQTVEELSKTIDVLNMVENQTGISMAGLIDGFSKSAGVARSAGIDVQHLAAMMAALVPAAGSAANAGNAIKTMVSRLLSPTKEAAQVLGLMGVSVKDVGWQSLNGSQRLELMSKSFNKLDDAQKAVVASTVASRWQINRFDVLMRDIANPMGYYQKSLKSVQSETDNYKQKVRELNAVLDSNPQKLKRIGVILQNSLADVIQPFVPVLVYFASVIAELGRKFSNLDPHVQKFILGGVAMLAIVGPLIRYIGATATMIGELGNVFLWILTPFGAALKLMFSLAAMPFSAIGTAIGGMAGMFVTAGKKILQSFAFATYGSGLIARMWEIIRVNWAVGQAVIVLMAKNWGKSIGALFEATMTFISTLVADTFAGGGMLGAIRASMSLWLLNVRAHLQLMAGLFMAWFRGTMLPIFTQGMLFLLNPFTAGLGALLSRAMTWGTPMVNAFWTVWYGIQDGFLFIATKVTAAFYAFTTTISTGWAFLSAELTVIQTRLSTWMSTAWAAMGAALTTIQTAIGTALVSAWEAIQLAYVNATIWMGKALETVYAGILVIGTKFGEAMAAIYAATARAGEILVTIWPAIIGGLRTAFVTIITSMGTTLLGGVRSIGLVLRGAIFGPWGIAAAAILALMWAFRDQIKKIWDQVVANFNGSGFKNAVSNVAQVFAPLVHFFQNAVGAIERAFFRLPEGVQNAFMAVVRIVQQAALAVYHLFSYLNPFAHHSPSLVENVTNGLAVVGAQFAKLPALVGNPVAKAYADLKNFKVLAASMMDGADSLQRAQDRADVAKVSPQLLGTWDTLVGDVVRLKAQLAGMDSAVASQQAVVDKWDASLQSANDNLDAQQKKLDQLQKNLDTLQAAYDAHKKAMEDYANAPIQGMKAMQDQIFANQMAQKKLQLQILQWEKANGSIDDMKNKMASLAGEIEKLKGESTDLRKAGAGSDILGPIDSQIKAMQQQYDAINKTAQNSPVSDLQQQLADLQQQGQILDLQNSINFDPLKKQIDDLANAQKELPFDQIMQGIKNEQDAMNQLADPIKKATDAVNAQKTAVDQATAARDAVQARYDTEKKKLDDLKKSYDQVQQAIQDVTSALNDMHSAANAIDAARTKAKGKKGKSDYLSPGAQNFLDAKGGNFPDVGGTGMQIGREGGIADQSAQIDQWAKQNLGDTSNLFKGMDMFKPIKDMWNSAWKWIKDNTIKFGKPVVDAIGQLFHGMSNPFSGGGQGGFVGGIKKTWDWITKTVKTAWDFIDGIIKLVAPDFKRTIDSLVKSGKHAWTVLGPAFTQLFKAVGNLLGVIWSMLKPVIALVGVALVAAFKIFASVFSNVIGPILNFWIDTFANIIKILADVIDFVANVFKGDWAAAWGDVWDIVKTIWDEIVSYFKNLPQLLWGIVKGLVEGVVGFFQWLWDVLVGHSIVPDTINAIVDWFAKLPGMAWDALKDFTSKMVDRISSALSAMWDAGKTAWDSIVKWIGNFASDAWNALKDLASKVTGRISDAFSSMWNTAKTAWGNITGWIGTLAQSAWNSLKDLAGKLASRASEAFTSFWNAEKTGWTNIYNWLTGLAQSAWNALKDIASKLWSRGSDALTGLYNGMTYVWGTVSSWLGGMASRVLSAIGKLGSTLWQKGVDLLTGYYNGITYVWETVYSWVHGLGGKVLSAIGNVGSVLYNAGKSILQGFLDGLKDKFEDIKNFVGGIGPWIAGHKGPRSYDLGLLVPHGGWIMQGLNTGLNNGMDDVLKTVQGVAPSISDALKPLDAVTGDALKMVIPRSVVADVTRAGARVAAATASSATTTTAQTGKTELHFHGDLSFPNVKNGQDAEDFISHLTGLVG